MIPTTIIAEESWYCRGNPNIPEICYGYFPKLLNKQQQRCCLGFECKQNGVSNRKLLDICKPEDIEFSRKEQLVKKLPHLVEEVGEIVNSDFAEKAIEINDGHLPHEQKKKALKKLWKDNGRKLIFVKTVKEMNILLKEIKNEM